MYLLYEQRDFHCQKKRIEDLGKKMHEDVDLLDLAKKLTLAEFNYACGLYLFQYARAKDMEIFTGFYVGFL